MPKEENKEKPDMKVKEGKAAKAEKTKKTEIKLAKVDDPFKVIRYVLMTEKAIQFIETQNKLVFIVDTKATKNSIKDAIESAFKSSVMNVKVVNDRQARKKAVVRFREEGAAGDIAMRLGIL